MQKIAIDIDEVLMPFVKPMAKWHGLKMPASNQRYEYVYKTMFNITESESSKMVEEFYQSEYFYKIQPIVRSQIGMVKLNSLPRAFPPCLTNFFLLFLGGVFHCVNCLKSPSCPCKVFNNFFFSLFCIGSAPYNRLYNISHTLYIPSLEKWVTISLSSSAFNFDKARCSVNLHRFAVNGVHNLCLGIFSTSLHAMCFLYDNRYCCYS